MKIFNGKQIITTTMIMSLMVLFVACGSDESEEITTVASETSTVTETVSEDLEAGEEASDDLGVTDIISSDISDNTYTDGTYTGVAQGFGDDLTVEVVIADNLIESIEVVAHNEHEEKYYGEPIATIPDLIVEAQDPIVDTVSGATYTSTGIINATIDALSQALISGELPDALELAENSGHKH